MAMKPGKRRRLDKSGAAESAEKRKASVRAKVRAPVLVRQAALRALARCATGGWRKNTQRIALLLGFATLLIAGRYAPG